MDWIDGFERITIVLTPILIAIIGVFNVWVEQRNKRRDAKREAEEIIKENTRKEHQKALDEKIASLSAKVSNIQTDVVGIKADMKNVTDENAKVQEKLNQVSEVLSINLEYSQSLGGVIMTIGNALSDNPDVNHKDISTAIDKHRAQEQKLMSSIYKALY